MVVISVLQGKLSNKSQLFLFFYSLARNFFLLSRLDRISKLSFKKEGESSHKRN